MSLTVKQAEIVKIYSDLAQDLESYPTRSDLLTMDVSRDKIRDHFGDMEKMKAAAIKAFPKKFKAINKKNEPHKHADFTKEAIGSIIKENNYKEGTFFITAVSPTSHLDGKESETEADIENLFVPGFNAVQNFLKRKNAELVLLPMPAHVKALKEQPSYYDLKLKKYLKNFATEYTFNSHLRAVELYINPQQVNPLTGLKRLRIHKFTGDYNKGTEVKRPKTSLIIAHSKQMMEVVATGNESHPRLVHSTGCITTPKYLRNRIGMLAENDHKLGGLIVEIQGDFFWLRQVQFDTVNGSFVDLGVRYHADGRATTERAEAFKMGDIHPGHHDDKAIEAMYKLWDIIKPKRVFFEDFFDGSSISHHLSNKRLTRAKLTDQFMDLPTEINMAKKVLESIWNKAPKDAELIATASNHPEHVMRYLNEGRYINDNKANYDIAHRMVVMALDGKNPLKEYLDPKSIMKWTNENDDIFIEGVQHGSHGHLGTNGAKGSKQSFELAFSNSMMAHTHTPSVFHDTFTVGHMSQPRHGYNQGISTWILCCGATYKGGQKQLYMIINGSAFRPTKKKK